MLCRRSAILMRITRASSPIVSRSFRIFCACSVDVLRYLLGGDLRKAFYDLCDLIPEASADILYGVLGILYDIV